MNEFYTKTIDTAAEFEKGIAQHNVFIDPDDNSISQMFDRFDDNTPNAAYIVYDYETLNRLKIYASLILANMYTLPDLYNILIKFKVNAGDCYIFSNYAPTVEGIAIKSTTTNCRITYRDVGGTLQYWNGAAWQAGATDCGTTTEGFVRCKKTATKYIMSIYDNNYVLQTQAEILISLTYVVAMESIYIGTIGLSDLDIFFIKGLINDKLSQGLFSQIIDMGVKKNIVKYSEIADLNVSDAAVSLITATSAVSLRKDASSERFSQGFKIKEDGIIDKITLRVGMNGTVAAGKNIWLEIWTDDGSGKPLAMIPSYISDYISTTIFTIGKQNTDFNFAYPKILAKNTQYHFVIKGDFTTSALNNIDIAKAPATTFLDGEAHDYDGASWTQVNITPPSMIGFQLRLKTSTQIQRLFSCSDNACFKTLDSQADFEGNSEVETDIDTATKSGYVLLEDTGGGVYTASGTIQNIIDLGATPADYCTLSTVFIAPQYTTITFKVAYSDLGVVYSALAAAPLINGVADLTSFGKHRFWKVEATLATTDTAFTPELNAWTIDSFPPMKELTLSTSMTPARYYKINTILNAVDTMESISLTSFELAFRMAYELYIKSVKYKINAGGVLADMDLSSI